MHRSVAFVVAFAALCASQRSSSALADAAPNCAADGACLDDGSEESALVQRKIQEHRQGAKLKDGGFPDFDNLKDSITDAVGSVKDAVGDLGIGALTTFAETVNSRLEGMRSKVESYSKEVNGSAEDIKRGVATILAKAFNVTITEIPTAKKYEDEAMTMLGEADSVWSVVSETMQAASTAIDTGLAVVGSRADGVREKVNATMQVALSRGKGVLESIEKLKTAIEEAKSNAKETLSGEAKDDSLLQTKMDPSSLLDTLNNAVAEASDQASAFAKAFSDTFWTLSEEVTGTVDDKVSADDLSKVHKAFKKVQATATDLANEVVAASSMIFSGVTEASAAAGEAAGVKSGAVGQPFTSWGLSLAAAAVLAAV